MTDSVVALMASIQKVVFLVRTALIPVVILMIICTPTIKVLNLPKFTK